MSQRVASPGRLFDRREFLKRGGLIGAAAIAGRSVLGCASIHDGTVIPCLGPALAPSAVSGMTYIRASEIGCALDCDLALGLNNMEGAVLPMMRPASMPRWQALPPITQSH